MPRSTLAVDPARRPPAVDPGRCRLSLDPARRCRRPRLKTSKPWIPGAIIGHGSQASPPSSDPVGRRWGPRLKMSNFALPPSWCLLPVGTDPPPKRSGRSPPPPPAVQPWSSWMFTASAPKPQPSRDLRHNCTPLRPLHHFLRPAEAAPAFVLLTSVRPAAGADCTQSPTQTAPWDGLAPTASARDRRHYGLRPCECWFWTLVKITTEQLVCAKQRHRLLPKCLEDLVRDPDPSLACCQVCFSFLPCSSSYAVVDAAT